MDLKIEHRNLFEFEILSLKGNFTHLQVYVLRKRVQEMLEAKKKRFALDFSRVNQLDLAAINVLHHIVKDVLAQPGGVIFIYGASTEMMKQLKESGLSQKLLIVRRFEEGLRRLAGENRS